MTLLVDADIIAYRVAYSAESVSVDDAIEKTDEVIGYLLQDATFSDGPAEYFLSGSSNFRTDVAVTAPYKGNRKGSEKPEFFWDVKQYLVDYYGASVSDGQEADDDIVIRHTELFPKGVIASLDKDFMQVEGWHYHTRDKTHKYVTAEEGQKFLYKQILAGDTADNIKGLYRVGMKTADKMLQDCTTEKEMYEACVKAYDGDVDRVLENARLLYLRRYEGEFWCPPE